MAIMEWLMVIFGLTLLIAGLVLGMSSLFMWRTLRDTFDPLVFNQKYFKPFDLLMYKGYPFGFGRIGSYALGVALKNNWFGRRYKGFNFREHVSHRTVILCRIFATAEIVGLISLACGLVCLPFVK